MILLLKPDYLQYYIMNNQLTIDSFFKSNSNTKNYDVKKYFYIYWDNNFNPKEQAYWISERPHKINFIQKVDCKYIKKGYYFYLCGYFKDYEENTYTIIKESKYKNIHYLKSHLQKNIRKQDINKTIQSTFHLMRLDLNELLRRLTIIHLEDTYLHESFTTLIWLMIANSTKKFKMKKYIYEWIMGFSYNCCITKKLDKTIDIKVNDNLYEFLDRCKDLNVDEYSLIYSLLLRAAYGGKEHDLNMMRDYAFIWFNRFKNKKKRINRMRIKPISIYVKDLDLECWDLSAIDYHCSPNILDYIIKKYPDYDKNEIKKMIWNNLSSINHRTNNEIYNEDIWNNIKLYIEKSQKYLLETNY